jgi:hypothetical protein
MRKDKDIPPGAIAHLDQIFTEADEKYAELIEMLGSLTEEYGMYAAMTFIGSSLDHVSHGTLVSMFLTGLRRELRNQEKSA